MEGGVSREMVLANENEGEPNQVCVARKERDDRKLPKGV